MERDINLAIFAIADDYSTEKQYDEEGHPYDMRWPDCVDHAIDDFKRDVVGFMECRGYDLNPDDAERVSEYADSKVNISSIWKFAYCS